MGMWGRAFYRCCSKPTGLAFCRWGVGALRMMGVSRGFRLPLECLSMAPADVASLCAMWERIHWSTGDGMMPPRELLAIYRLASIWPAEGDIVELGAWTGGTTCYLAAACRARGGGRVHAIDTFRGTKEGGGTYQAIEKFGGSTWHEFEDRIHRAGLESLVRPRVGLTTDVAAEYAGPRVRVLLIDADHSYHGVRADFLAWTPHMAPGGLVVFHDYLMADVRRFVQDEVVGRDGFLAAPGAVEPNMFAVTCVRPPMREARAPGAIKPEREGVVVA